MADTTPSRFHLPAGFSNSLDFAMFFNAWAAKRNSGLTVNDIQARFEVSRATAYRWLRSYRDAIERNRARTA